MPFLIVKAGMIKTNLSALIANGKEDFYKAAGFYESITGLRAGAKQHQCIGMFRNHTARNTVFKKSAQKNAVNV